MFKRILIFIGISTLLCLFFLESKQLDLRFYVFFPFLLIPAYVFYEREDTFFLSLMLTCLALIYGVRCFYERSWEILFFGVGILLFVLVFLYYLRQWRGAADFEFSQDQDIQKNFNALQKKYDSRLESLHHLEHQVSGLLDLFEIAKEFSDCMGFQRLAEILQKKVSPEIPFKKMIFMIPKSLEKITFEGNAFFIEADKIQFKDVELTSEEKELFDEVFRTKQFTQREHVWVFPLMTDGKITSAVMIHGAETDDLAKFEVLTAYLALQVKKIQLYETVKELSIRDGLTGVFVRRHFMVRFEEELKRSLKYKLPLAVLMLDIDHFKRYNDDYGHLAGDATLKQVASLLTESLRKVDIVARYGGEEFIVVSPETRQEGALEIAERIRSNIARHAFKIYNNKTRVTVSIGVASFLGNEAAESSFNKDLPASLIDAADQALYRAKEEGRNRVICAT